MEQNRKIPEPTEMQESDLATVNGGASLVDVDTGNINIANNSLNKNVVGVGVGVLGTGVGIVWRLNGGTPDGGVRSTGALATR